MLKNYKEVKNSRLDLKDSDYKFFMDQTGLSRAEVEKIFKIFDDKGGVLNRIQFKQTFEALNKNWLANYKNINEISDFVFRSFDKGFYKKNFINNFNYVLTFISYLKIKMESWN